MPLTLRLIFHGVRSAMLGIMIMLVGWISLTPASPQERTALRATIGEERPDGLVPMRIARAFVHFAPARAAQMLSDASDGEISPELAGMMLRDMAQGPISPDQIADSVASDERDTRSTSGAKFVTVD